MTYSRDIHVIISQMATGDLLTLDSSFDVVAAREHALAVTRDYISQPRLSAYRVPQWGGGPEIFAKVLLYLQPTRQFRE